MLFCMYKAQWPPDKRIYVVEAYQLDTRTLHLLHQTAEYFSDQRQSAYLVGGSLRNILLGQQCVDWDIVTTGKAHRLARRLADKLGAYYVHLHEKASRVVVVLDTDSPNNPKQEITFDISPLNGKTIEDDLRQRDFTINAIAAPLGDIVQYLEMDNTGAPDTIDPLHALPDTPVPGADAGGGLNLI